MSETRIIYYQSKFSFILNNGAEPIDFPDYDWQLELFTDSSKKKYKAGKTGEETYNCANKDGKLEILVQDHQLGEGQLKGIYKAYVGGRIVSRRRYLFNIVLSADMGEDITAGDVEAIVAPALPTTDEIIDADGTYKVHYRNDFNFILLDKGTKKPVAFPTCDWWLDIWTDGSPRRYRASCIDGEMTNCENWQGQMRIWVKNHGLKEGRLKGVYVVSSDNQDNYYAQDFGIELIHGLADNGELYGLLIANYIKSEFEDLTDEQIEKILKPVRAEIDSLNATVEEQGELVGISITQAKGKLHSVALNEEDLKDRLIYIGTKLTALFGERGDMQPIRDIAKEEAERVTTWIENN